MFDEYVDGLRALAEERMDESSRATIRRNTGRTAQDESTGLEVPVVDELPDGVSGGQLADRARRQAVRFGAELLLTRDVVALMAIGLNVHFGYTGLLQFGQIAFAIALGLSLLGGLGGLLVTNDLSFRPRGAPPGARISAGFRTETR